MGPKRRMLSCTVAALALIAPIAASHALGDDGAGFERFDHGYASALAGYLVIDGHEFRITTGRRIRSQIHDAFECVGYDAWYRGDRVMVRVGYHRPRIRWRPGRYELAVSLRGGYLSIRAYRPRYASCDRYRYHRHHQRYVPSCSACQVRRWGTGSRRWEYGGGYRRCR